MPSTVSARWSPRLLFIASMGVSLVGLLTLANRSFLPLESGLLTIVVAGVLAYGLRFIWKLRPALARIIPALNAICFAVEAGFMLIGPDSLFGVSNADIANKVGVATFLLMPFTLLSLLVAFAMNPPPLLPQ